MIYGTVDQLLVKYPHIDITSADLSGTWMPYGALRVNESLGGTFTIPFSSNNATARDLSLDFAYHGILTRTRSQNDSQELGDAINSRILQLIEGELPMTTDSGDALYADGRPAVWSTHGNYKPIFNVGDPMRQRVDPDLLDELDSRDD